MNTEYLHEFVELAKHLNYTETARILLMSQPTLSKHIAQLEKGLRIELFERSGNTLKLTSAGQALLPYAYQILDAEHDFQHKASELRVNPLPRLTISGLTDEGPSMEVLGYLLSLLSDKYGNGFLEVKSRYNRDPVQMLDANEVDIVYDPTYEENDFSEEMVEALHIADLRLSAIVDNGHPLASRDVISFDDLATETLFKYEGLYLSRSWNYIEGICRNHGFEAKTRSIPCASVAEMFAHCANLDQMVLIVGSNFGDRIPAGIRSFCTPIPISDADAAIPFYFMYRRDNDNPVLKEALELIMSRDLPALRFE